MKIQRYNNYPATKPAFGRAFEIPPQKFIAKVMGEDIAQQTEIAIPKLKEIANDVDMFVEVYHSYKPMKNNIIPKSDVGFKITIQDDSEKIEHPIQRFMAAHNWIERPQVEIKTPTTNKSNNFAQDLINGAKEAKERFLEVMETLV